MSSAWETILPGLLDEAMSSSGMTRDRQAGGRLHPAPALSLRPVQPFRSLIADVRALPPRLTAGSRARVTGRLAGRRVGFDVEVYEADLERLALAADGPVGLDVAYDLSATDDGSEVRASISVRSGKGITGRLMAEATNALLSAGALTHAISRLAREAACPV